MTKKHMKMCIICGAPFKPIATAICCSVKCTRERTLQRKHKCRPLAGAKKCIICGAIFNSVTNKKSCSIKCRDERVRQRQRSNFSPEAEAIYQKRYKEKRRRAYTALQALKELGIEI